MKQQTKKPNIRQLLAFDRTNQIVTNNMAINNMVKNKGGLKALGGGVFQPIRKQRKVSGAPSTGKFPPSAKDSSAACSTVNIELDPTKNSSIDPKAGKKGHLRNKSEALGKTYIISERQQYYDSSDASTQQPVMSSHGQNTSIAQGEAKLTFVKSSNLSWDSKNGTIDQQMPPQVLWQQPPQQVAGPHHQVSGATAPNGTYQGAINEEKNLPMQGEWVLRSSSHPQQQLHRDSKTHSRNDLEQLAQNSRQTPTLLQQQQYETVQAPLMQLPQPTIQMTAQTSSTPQLTNQSYQQALAQPGALPQQQHYAQQHQQHQQHHPAQQNPQLQHPQQHFIQPAQVPQHLLNAHQQLTQGTFPRQVGQSPSQKPGASQAHQQQQYQPITLCDTQQFQNSNLFHQSIPAFRRDNLGAYTPPLLAASGEKNAARAQSPTESPESPQATIPQKEEQDMTPGPGFSYLTQPIYPHNFLPVSIQQVQGIQPQPLASTPMASNQILSSSGIVQVPQQPILLLNGQVHQGTFIPSTAPAIVNQQAVMGPAATTPTQIPVSYPFLAASSPQVMTLQSATSLPSYQNQPTTIMSGRPINTAAGATSIPLEHSGLNSAIKEVLCTSPQTENTRKAKLQTLSPYHQGERSASKKKLKRKSSKSSTRSVDNRDYNSFPRNGSLSNLQPLTTFLPQKVETSQSEQTQLNLLNEAHLPPLSTRLQIYEQIMNDQVPGAEQPEVLNFQNESLNEDSYDRFNGGFVPVQNIPSHNEFQSVEKDQGFPGKHYMTSYQPTPCLSQSFMQQTSNQEEVNRTIDQVLPHPLGSKVYQIQKQKCNPAAPSEHIEGLSDIHSNPISIYRGYSDNVGSGLNPYADSHGFGCGGGTLVNRSPSGSQGRQRTSQCQLTMQDSIQYLDSLSSRAKLKNYKREQHSELKDENNTSMLQDSLLLVESHPAPQMGKNNSVQNTLVTNVNFHQPSNPYTRTSADGTTSRDEHIRILNQPSKMRRNHQGLNDGPPNSCQFSNQQIISSINAQQSKSANCLDSKSSESQSHLIFSQLKSEIELLKQNNNQLKSKLSKMKSNSTLKASSSVNFQEDEVKLVQEVEEKEKLIAYLEKRYSLFEGKRASKSSSSYAQVQFPDNFQQENPPPYQSRSSQVLKPFNGKKSSNLTPSQSSNKLVSRFTKQQESPVNFNINSSNFTNSKRQSPRFEPSVQQPVFREDETTSPRSSKKTEKPNGDKGSGKKIQMFKKTWDYNGRMVYVKVGTDSANSRYMQLQKSLPLLSRRQARSATPKSSHKKRACSADTSKPIRKHSHKSNTTSNNLTSSAVRLTNQRRVLNPTEKDKSPKQFRTMQRPTSHGLTSTRRKSLRESASCRRQASVDRQKLFDPERPIERTERTQRNFQCTEQQLKSAWKLAHQRSKSQQPKQEIAMKSILKNKTKMGSRSGSQIGNEEDLTQRDTFEVGNIYLEQAPSPEKPPQRIDRMCNRLPQQRVHQYSNHSWAGRRVHQESRNQFSKDTTLTSTNTMDHVICPKNLIRQKRRTSSKKKADRRARSLSVNSIQLIKESMKEADNSTQQMVKNRLKASFKKDETQNIQALLDQGAIIAQLLQNTQPQFGGQHPEEHGFIFRDEKSGSLVEISGEGSVITRKTSSHPTLENQTYDLEKNKTAVFLKTSSSQPDQSEESRAQKPATAQQINIHLFDTQNLAESTQQLGRTQILNTSGSLPFYPEPEERPKIASRNICIIPEKSQSYLESCEIDITPESPRKAPNPQPQQVQKKALNSYSQIMIKKREHQKKMKENPSKKAGLSQGATNQPQKKKVPEPVKLQSGSTRQKSRKAQAGSTRNDASLKRRSMSKDRMTRSFGKTLTENNGQVTRRINLQDLKRKAAANKDLEESLRYQDLYNGKGILKDKRAKAQGQHSNTTTIRGQQSMSTQSRIVEKASEDAGMQSVNVSVIQEGSMANESSMAHQSIPSTCVNPSQLSHISSIAQAQQAEPQALINSLPLSQDESHILNFEGRQSPPTLAYQSVSQPFGAQSGASTDGSKDRSVANADLMSEIFNFKKNVNEQIDRLYEYYLQKGAKNGQAMAQTNL